MNSHVPKVTVCIVTYNQEQYIRECLESVVSQSSDICFEVIISDDCSTDSTARIIEEYAEKYRFIKPILRSKNIGSFKNFIETHNLATGEYVCHLDGDDRWLPGKLKAQCDFLDANSDYTVCWTRANLFNDIGGFYQGERYDYSMFEDGLVTFDKSLRLGSVAVHSSIMYRRCSRKTKDSELELLDLYYTLEFLSSGKGKILQNTYSEYRVSSTGAMTADSYLKIRKLNCEIASFYFSLYREKRKSIFLFALFNLCVDIKNLRKSAFGFFNLLIRTLSFVSLTEIYHHFSEARKLVVPSLTSESKND